MAAKSKPYNQTQLKQFRKLLEERREELVSSVRNYAESVPDNGLQGATGDSADHASSDYATELFGALLERQSGTLEEVEKALEKIDNGEYGKCECCEGKILSKRLKAIPWAKLCRDCQEKKDKQSAVRKNMSSPSSR